MSVSADEDVFTILTEDFEIPCDTARELCGPAKYAATKKCCGLQLLFCQVCVDWMTIHKISFMNALCAECGKVAIPGTAFVELFIINPL